MPVRGQLGSLEAEDVVAAAREWGRRTYVDKKRIGIWGWVSLCWWWTGRVTSLVCACLTDEDEGGSVIRSPMEGS